MNAYLVFKALHVLGAMVVFGTGIGIAWYALRGWRTGDIHIMQWISAETVAADWIFTAAAILLLLGSASGMLYASPTLLEMPWLRLSAFLTFLVFCLWVPVVFIQYNIRRRLRTAPAREAAPGIRRLLVCWYLLGALVLPLMVAIVFLMVMKPAF
ncbi:DUF2269 domain-containing protein [Microbulbifer sp. M83]|uniref:DUF2269 domain-containing protein n=1 Tax=Microbulbifer sp. M83 TaxID=3118246 RepID=UPI002FE29681